MKFNIAVAVFLSVLLSMARAAAIVSDADARTTYEKSILRPDGSYEYAFDTDNLLHRTESGALEAVGEGAETALKVDGISSYETGEGSFSLIYHAGTEGFVAIFERNDENASEVK